jgi:phage gp36-like protein
MYTTRAQIQALIRAATLAEMLDDDRDGEEDAGLLDGIIAAACRTVDAALGVAVATALVGVSPIPPVVEEAATLAACYLLFRRLPTEDAKNPFADSANAAMERCRAIGRGEAALVPVAAAGGVGNVELKFDDAGQEGL